MPRSFYLRSFFVALACLLLTPNLAAAREPELIAYRSTPAADGSVLLELDFDTFAPQWQIVHAKRDDVKIVLIGVERGRDLPGIFPPAGAILRGQIAPFAGVGLVVDLALNADVRPRGESFGNRLVFHIPSRTSDEEAHLKISTIAEEPGVKIIRLSFADVSEVAGLIKNGVTVPAVDQFNAQSPFAAPTPNPNSSYSSSSSSSPIASSPTYVTLPTLALLPKDTAQGVYVNENVSVDRRLNAVILRGTPEQMAPYEAMIRLVDTPRRAVLLETQIVELTQTAAKDFGFNYSPNGSLATATFNAGNAGALQPNGVPADTRPRTSLSISATLDALESQGQAKILAQPRILATDNRIAAILSGEAVPIFNTVTIPQGGTTIVTQQLQYINVGVSLEILPRISSQGQVTADIFSEVSSIIDYVQTAPRIAVRQELTQASVGDGQSILIGGLLQDTEIKNLSKIPGLGDLPILGNFFKETTVTSQKTNLYLVITPHILTKDSAAARPPQR
jgi:type II secretory pathway component GspD/PulD (secretin)